MKVQISLDDKLLERIDTFAKDNYMSRSGLISFASNQFLNSAELTGLMKDMSLAMRKIADNGDVDAETIQQLEDFERLCKIMTGQK